MQKLINTVGVISLLLGLYYATFFTLIGLGAYMYLTSSNRRNLTPEEEISYSIIKRREYE